MVEALSDKLYDSPLKSIGTNKTINNQKVPSPKKKKQSKFICISILFKSNVYCGILVLRIGIYL